MGKRCHESGVGVSKGNTKKDRTKCKTEKMSPRKKAKRGENPELCKNGGLLRWRKKGVKGPRDWGLWVKQPRPRPRSGHVGPNSRQGQRFSIHKGKNNAVWSGLGE